jgi:hypothetical protein
MSLPKTQLRRRSAQSLSFGKQQAQGCTEKQGSDRLLPVVNRDEAGLSGADFEHAYGYGTNSTASTSAFAFGPGLFSHSTRAGACTESVSDSYYGDDRLLASGHSVSENAFYLGSAGKVLVQGLQ